MTTVILAMLAVTIFVGGLSIYEVDQYIQEQSEGLVEITCTNESGRINSSLKNMEKSVKIMASYLLEFFDSEQDVSDPAVQERVLQSAELMFADVAKNTSTEGAVSYYFRLDPAVSDGKTGLFYSKSESTGEFVSVAPTDIFAYDKNDVEHVGWFWLPYEAQRPIWMKPYHNQNSNVWMISYVIPLYCGERFIGVVGMDFDYRALESQVQRIRVYENGFARLEMDGALLSDSEVEPDRESHLRVSAELVNGMELVLFASYDDIRQIRNEIGLKILFITVPLSALFIALAVFVVKRITDPLHELTKAAAQLADGNYDTVIAPSNAREIQLLGDAFENMAHRLREREEHLHLSAHRDSMTGLRNTTSYASWMARFDGKIASGEENDFGIAMFDLNDLKKANDVYGHETGDALIVTAAKLISDVFKRSPVFRIGGDEFVVVLRNEDLAHYEELLALLKDRCQSTVVADMQTPVSIAAGFARFERDKDQCFADVFKRADDAMYENKRLMKQGA